MIINELINFNILRFSGKEEILEKEILNISNHKNTDGIYTLSTFSNKNDYAQILHLLKNKELLESPLLQEISSESLNDIFYILEIFLRIFDFHKSFYINNRLMNFSFINILSNNNSKRDFKQLSLDFKNLLFFNPCSEDFITKNQIIDGKYFNDNKLIDFKYYFESIFKNIFQLKKEKKAYTRIAKKDIDSLYSILKEIIEIVFEAKDTKITKLYNDLEKLFATKENLYNSLIKSISNFRLINIKENDKVVSLYYNSNESIKIENLTKKNSLKKFKSEYLIDSYIFKYSENPNEFIDFLTYLKNYNYNTYIKFSIILFSHPFIMYNQNAKMNLSKSNIDKFIPENGYAKDKLIKYKEIFLGN